MELRSSIFATTALIATAGIASADVSISGFAEMGFQNADTLTTTLSQSGSTVSSSTTKSTGQWQFFQDIDVTFSMTGETDNGLSFGASVDIDETAAGTTTSDDHGTTVFVSAAFGTLTMGDTDGAFDWALTETGMGGSIADDHTSHAGYNGNSGLDGAGDGQVLRYNYSVNGFGFAVSFEQGSNGAANSDDITAVGVTYTMDMAGASVTLGAGTQDYGNSDRTGFSVKAATNNGLTFVANMSSGTDAAVANRAGVTEDRGTNNIVATPAVAPRVAVAQRDVDTMGLGFAYTADALTVAVNYGEVDYSGGNASDTEGYGIAINYALGGGAVAQFGYGNSDRDGTALDSETMSIGIAMSF